MSIKIILKSYFLKFLGLHKIKKIQLTDSPKFLILMHQNIGDMIVCSPILRELKKAYPKCNLQVIASKNNHEIATTNPNIDVVHIYENKWNKLLPLLIKLRANHFDISIELEAKIVTRVILMLRIIRPSCILSVSKREGRYGIRPQDFSSYDFYTDQKLNHQRDTCLDILRLLDIKCSKKNYDIFYHPKHKERATIFLKNFKSNDIIVGLNISGSSQEKKIFDDDVKKIITGLHALNKKIKIILLHKPDFKESIDRLISNENKSYAFPSYSTKSILDVAALVDSLDLLITPDTSLVHIACAFNIPLLAIYRNDPVAFEAWHPKSSNHFVVFSDDIDSLNSIDTDEIVSKCYVLISQYVAKDLKI
jgi:ADP-heptose:LPS heptosyltransferase